MYMYEIGFMKLLTCVIPFVKIIFIRVALQEY